MPVFPKAKNNAITNEGTKLNLQIFSQQKKLYLDNIYRWVKALTHPVKILLK